MHPCVHRGVTCDRRLWEQPACPAEGAGETAVVRVTVEYWTAVGKKGIFLLLTAATGLPSAS